MDDSNGRPQAHPHVEIVGLNIVSLEQEFADLDDCPEVDTGRIGCRPAEPLVAAEYSWLALDDVIELLARVCEKELMLIVQVLMLDQGALLTEPIYGHRHSNQLTESEEEARTLRPLRGK